MKYQNNSNKEKMLKDFKKKRKKFKHKRVVSKGHCNSQQHWMLRDIEAVVS